MRLLRLDFRDQRATLDLHPLLTVLTRAEAGIQAQIFATFRRVSRGETLGLRGLMQHDGRLFELNPSVGRPLGALSTSTAVLIPIDVVDDRAGAAVMRSEIQHWESQATIDSIAVEELRFQLNLTALADLADQASALSDTDAACLERRERQATRVLAVAKVLELVRREPPHITLPDEARDPLLQRWRDYLESVEHHNDHLYKLSEGLAAADRQVARAADRVAKAKAAAVPVRLTDEQESRVEELVHRRHERSLFRRGRLSPTEQAELEALFAIVGVTSWTGYTIYRADPRPTSDREEELEQALHELEEAATYQERLVREFQADEIAVSLETELAAIRKACRPLLGLPMPSDIGVALQNQIDKVENPAWHDVGAQLRDVVASIGLTPPPGLELMQLVAWAESWVAEQARVELSNLPESASASSDGEHPDDNGKARTASVLAASATGTTMSNDQLATAFSGLITDEDLRRLEKTAEQHRRALGQIQGAEREAVRSALRLRSLAGCLERQVDGRPVTSADDVVNTVVASVAQLTEDGVGSLPVVLVGDLLSLGEPEVGRVMEVLAELSHQVQIVLLTENYHAVRWVEQAGPQVGLVSRARPRPTPAGRRPSPHTGIAAGASVPKR